MLGIKFRGRISRLTFFGYLLVCFCFYLLLWAVSEIFKYNLDTFAYDTQNHLWTFFVIMTLTLYILLLSISSHVRRLHDLDRSGWWSLLTLIPFINFILACILLLAKGTKTTNKFD
jgi:uncharacterized membrane protein YhaH (DUF805 family)